MFSVRFACLNGQLQSISLPSQTRPWPKIVCTWDYWVIDYPMLTIIAVWQPTGTNKRHAQLQRTVRNGWFLPTLLDARAHASDGFQWQTQVETRSFCLDVLQEKKLSVLLIKNGDKLCCARAIVTAKAGVEQHPNCDGFKRGRRIQAEHAVDLHHKRRVPPGPCGYDEL